MKLVQFEAHEDHRGHLFEIFRLTQYPDIKMAYVVTINPGKGRDWHQWHYHNHKTEMFICLSGSVWMAGKEPGGNVVALYPLLHSIFNMLVFKPGDRHSAVNLGLGSDPQPATLLVLCDQYYSPDDEYREPIQDWSWDEYRGLLNE